MVTIPFYATSSEQQIQFMINDARVRILFVGEQEQYDKARRVFSHCPSMERIIIFDGQVRIAEHDANAMYFSDFLKLGGGIRAKARWKACMPRPATRILPTYCIQADHGRQ